VPGGDQAPPVTTAIVSPEQPNGQNGWYKQPVTVSLTAQDAESSVTQTVYRLDGETAWRAYTAPILFDKDGRYSVSYRSTDHEGNAEAPKTISFNIDGTAPVIVVAVPFEGTYSSAEDLTPQFTATDSVSGIDVTKTVAILDGKPVQTGKVIALYALELGTHEFTVTASDLAGNTTSRTVRFQTAASLDSLKVLVKRFKSRGWIDNKGIETSLLTKLNAGNVKSFIQEVEAQAGKHVSNEAATVLLRDARTL
jgi:fibronectin type 3 domain-containing protein